LYTIVLLHEILLYKNCETFHLCLLILVI
jgi:hypothetical protein